MFFTALSLRQLSKRSKIEEKKQKEIRNEINDIRKKHQPELDGLISEQDLIKKAKETITHITKSPATPINIS